MLTAFTDLRGLAIYFQHLLFATCPNLYRIDGMSETEDHHINAGYYQ
ncbi:hypothetical protein [Endozoicomonas sp. SESOKO1]|nr:hypothetical protein [Endozoicomonas sp. SESOKO1]